MRDEVELKDVTADNWQAVAALELDPAQEDLVASNRLFARRGASSIPMRARARSMPASALVGFLMYDVGAPTRAARGADLPVHDRPQHQGKGYGRAALAKALDEIRAIPGSGKSRSATCRTIRSRSRSTPASASSKSALDEDGEMIAELAL